MTTCITQLTADSTINEVRSAVMRWAHKNKKKGHEAYKTISQALKRSWAMAKSMIAKKAQAKQEFVLERKSKKEVRRGASEAQYKFLASLIGEDELPSKHAFTKYFDVKDVSAAISHAQIGGKVVID